jgi:hypothetical protein
LPFGIGHGLNLNGTVWCASVTLDPTMGPWFIATLFDCYFGFLTFYAWLFYKETGWFSRIG